MKNTIHNTYLAAGLQNPLTNLPVLTDAWYSNKDITLDGYIFVRCRFDNCRLYVSSSNFELVDCLVDQTTNINYSGNTHRIIQLFLSKYEWVQQHIPTQFRPVRNVLDKTITIK